MNICFVTTEIYSPFLEGDIERANYYLSKLFASEGYGVTILFTGPIKNKSLSYWKSFYSDLGVEFVSIKETDRGFYYFPNVEHLNVSRRVYIYLKDKEFKVVIFSDCQALSFISIQAKRTGLSFAETTLLFIMNRPQEWYFEISMNLVNNDYYNTMLNWCERYCCENIDILIAPSQAVFDWALSRDWVLADDRRVIHNYMEEVSSLEAVMSENIDFTHLIFFGDTIATRNGVELFCLGIEKVLKNKLGSVKKLSFLGEKGNIVDGFVKESSDVYIKYFFKAYRELEIKIEKGLTAFEAMDYIKKTSGVVVIPTRGETFCYAVLECMENKVPFIASRVGGIPEFAPDELLFDLDVNSLADKILSLKDLFPKDYEGNYSRERIKEQWKELLDNLPKRKELELKESPKVTICIPYYNTGKYLPTTLKSIAEVDYDNYDVVVVDDGSEDEYSKEVFEEMKAKYEDWKFLRLDKNSGLSAARNFAVSNSSSEYLMFIDSDDIYKKDILKDYVRGMAVSGVDCLSSYCTSFNDVAGKPDDISGIKGSYRPIGPCLELGMFENVFGGHYLFVKRSIFNELGGFDPDSRRYEDYQFLIRLSLRGYKQDVLPKSIMWYRVREDSLYHHSGLSEYDMRMMALNEYNAVLPPFAKYLNYYTLSMGLAPKTKIEQLATLLSLDLVSIAFLVKSYVANKLKNYPLLFSFARSMYVLMLKSYRLFHKLFKRQLFSFL